jgi:hypothetical protein
VKFVIDEMSLEQVFFSEFIRFSPILLTHLSPPHTLCNTLTRQHIVVPSNFKFGFVCRAADGWLQSYFPSAKVG